jgi:hypothetical protein
MLGAMSTKIRAFLEDDHRRLDELLAAAVAGDRIEVAPYEELRAGLLRHIGMEERILLPAAKRLRGGDPLPEARLLRADHGALVAMLVPTPTPAIVERIGAVLALHNPIEEGTDGIYAACERLAAGEADALLAQLERAPPVPLAPHFDGPRAFEAIDRLLRGAGELRGDAELFIRAAPDLAR